MTEVYKKSGYETRAEMNKQHLELLQGLHNRLCALESTAILNSHTRVSDERGFGERRTPRDTARRAKRAEHTEDTVESIAQRDRVLADQRDRQELQDLQDQRKVHEKSRLREQRNHQDDLEMWRRKQQWHREDHQLLQHTHQTPRPPVNRNVG